MTSNTLKPLVSICIPTYNGDRFISETIESILNQTFSDFELLVSDHSSSDQTVEILRTFADPRIKVFNLARDEPASMNWNACTAQASGRYIKIVCQDDILLKNCIDSEVSLLESYPTAAFCFSPRDIISPKGRTLIRNRGLKPQTQTINFENMISSLIRSGTNFFGESCALLIRRDKFLHAGVFEGQYLIDLEMWVRLWLLGDAVYYPKSLSRFRISKGSWTSQLQSQHAKQIELYFKKMHEAWPYFISQDDLNYGIRKAVKLEKQRSILTSLVEKLRL